MTRRTKNRIRYSRT